MQLVWLFTIHEHFGDDIIRGILFMNTNILFDKR